MRLPLSELDTEQTRTLDGFELRDLSVLGLTERELEDRAMNAAIALSFKRNVSLEQTLIDWREAVEIIKEETRLTVEIIKEETRLTADDLGTDGGLPTEG